MMLPSVYTRSALKKESPTFRIEAIISDGMWYSFSKWKRLAQVTDEELQGWIDESLSSGELIQSKTGAKSFRVGHEYIKTWHREHGAPEGMQLLDFLFPPRIWGGMTEIEGFLEAPLREIGIVSFICASNVADEVIEALRGVARVRVDQKGNYKAYGLSAGYIKEIIQGVFAKHPTMVTDKIYSRNESKRREMVDFSNAYANSIVHFYVEFGKSLAKKEKETIQIFLPDYEDQRSQMVMWVITAIEKFDESASVPFSGYLDSVLKRWPYDLPMLFLGKDLSSFQRERSRALTRLRAKHNDSDGIMSFSATAISEEMGLSSFEFTDLEESHKAWLRSQTATTLTWGETAEEKSSTNVMEPLETAESDLDLASEISYGIIEAALSTGLYEDAITTMSQIDLHDIDMRKLNELSMDFVVALGKQLQDR